MRCCDLSINISNNETNNHLWGLDSAMVTHTHATAAALVRTRVKPGGNVEVVPPRSLIFPGSPVSSTTLYRLWQHPHLQEHVYMFIELSV